MFQRKRVRSLEAKHEMIWRVWRTSNEICDFGAESVGERERTLKKEWRIIQNSARRGLNLTLVISLSEPIKPQDHPLHFQHRALKSLSVKQKILYEDSGLSTELEEPSHRDYRTPWKSTRSVIIYNYFKFLDPNHLSACSY